MAPAFILGEDPVKRMHIPIAVFLIAALFLAACGGAADTSAPGPSDTDVVRHQFEQELIKHQEKLAIKRAKVEDLRRKKKEDPSQNEQEDLDILRAVVELQRQNVKTKQLCEELGNKNCDDPSIKSRVGRGFFTNSASGSVSDVDRFIDPTTLAVISILLTLLATSISLVRGN